MSKFILGIVVLGSTRCLAVDLCIFRDAAMAQTKVICTDRITTEKLVIDKLTDQYGTIGDEKGVLLVKKQLLDSGYIFRSPNNDDLFIK